MSGDLYSRRPVIGPIAPVRPVAPADADEGGAPVASEPMSVAGALSAVDEPLVPLAILKPKIPIFARARYHSYLRVTSVSRAGAGPTSRAMRAHDHSRAVQLHAAAGRPVQGHVPGYAVAHRDDEALKSGGAVSVLPDRRAVLRGPAVRGRCGQRQRHARLGVEVLPSRHARNRYAGRSRPACAGA